MDGLGDAAAGYYLAKQLLETYDVTLLLYLAPPKEHQLLTLIKNEDYINNIDTNGYLTLDGNYHKFKHTFNVIGDTEPMVYLSTDYLVRLYGLAFSFDYAFEFANMPSIRISEFTVPNGSITGGIGPGCSGIYFDRELRNFSGSKEFLGKYLDSPLDVDVYMTRSDQRRIGRKRCRRLMMTYGRNQDLRDLYIKLASRLSVGRKMIIFSNEKAGGRYVEGNKLFIYGSLSELDFKRVIGLSNKIVHCTGNNSVSQVLSAKKIPIYDYLPHANLFRTRLYSDE